MRKRTFMMALIFWLIPSAIAQAQGDVERWIESIGGEYIGEPPFWARLSHKKVRDSDMAKLSKLKSLKMVELHGTAIGDVGLKHLADGSFPTWISLEIGMTRVTDEGLKHVARLKHLSILDLTGTRVSDNGVSHLAALTELESLNLSLTSVTDKSLKEIARLGALKTLGVWGTGIEGEGFSELGRLKNLTHVSIGGNGSHLLGKHIRNLSSIKSLRKLTVGETKNPLTRDDCQNLLRLGQLQALHLVGANLEAGVLFEFGKLKRLKSVSVFDSVKIDEKIAESLSTLKELESLHVDSIEVSALKHIAEINSVESLSLKGCKVISDSELDYFSKMKNLKMLDLTGTRVTQKGIAILQQRLAGCFIAPNLDSGK